MNKPFRSHFSIVFEKNIGFLVFLCIFVYNIVSNLGDDFDFSNLNIIKDSFSKFKLEFFIVLLILILIFIIQFLIWKNTYMYFNNKNFIIEKNGLFKYKKTLPLKNIASVNINENFFQKLIGTCSIKFDLNSSSLSDTDNIKIVLKHDKGIELKSFILSNSNENFVKSDSQNIDYTCNDSIIDFSLSDIIKHSFFTLSSVTIIFSLITLIMFIYNMVIESSKKSLFEIFYIIIGIIIFQLFSFITKILKYYDFKFNRKDNIINISYGFFDRKTYSFSVNKINGILIKQSILGKIFNMYSLEGMVAGLSDEDNESPALCLCVNKVKLNYVMDALIPEFKNSGEVISSPINSLFVKLIYSSFICIPLIILSFFTNWWFIYFFISVFIYLYSYLKYKYNTIILGDNLFSFSKGAFDSTILTIPYKNIQLVTIKTSPLKKVFNIKSGNFSCISDSFDFLQSIGQFQEDCFNKLSKKIL